MCVLNQYAVISLFLPFSNKEVLLSAVALEYIGRNSSTVLLLKGGSAGASTTQ